MSCATAMRSDRLTSAFPTPDCRQAPPRAVVGAIAVLPQENAAFLEARLVSFLRELQPSNDAEAELIRQAARVSWMIERADRAESAHLAHRVRKAEFQAGRSTTRAVQRAHELGRRLMHDARPAEANGMKSPAPRWVDEPAVFLHALESTREGCRWLLDRWQEFRNLLDRKVKWSLSDVFRFHRLLGKQGVEAVNDPALNAFFLAWDVLWPGLGKEIWKASRARSPERDPALQFAMEWREIAIRPAGPDEAWTMIRAEVDRRISGLSALLVQHSRLAATDAADRAALDLSTGFARHRRHRLALGRELVRLVESLRKRPRGPVQGQSQSQNQNQSQNQDPHANHVLASSDQPEPRHACQDRQVAIRPPRVVSEASATFRARDNARPNARQCAGLHSPSGSTGKKRAQPVTQHGPGSVQRVTANPRLRSARTAAALAPGTSPRVPREPARERVPVG